MLASTSRYYGQSSQTLVASPILLEGLTRAYGLFRFHCYRSQALVNMAVTGCKKPSQAFDTAKVPGVFPFFLIVTVASCGFTGLCLDLPEGDVSSNDEGLC